MTTESHRTPGAAPLRVALGATCVFAAAALHVAHAQQAGGATANSANEGAELTEVVITAQKRPEKMQDVPIAVTALDASDLQAQGVGGTLELTAAVPGLNFTDGVGVYGLPVIRSVGTTSQGPGIENPVATYVDGVYMVAASSSLMSLNDVSQVAVLKGPQGTLFGRNATGGLIQVTTKDPTHDFNGNVQGTVGSVGTSGEGLYLNGGLTQTLAANFAFSNDEQTRGFGRNLYTGQYVDTRHSTAMRGKLLWQPDEKTDITLSLDYARTRATLPAYRIVNDTVFNTPTPGGPFDINLNVTPAVAAREGGLSLNARHDFDSLQFVSISAWRNGHTHDLFDADGVPAPILTIDQTQRNSQFSQEFQLISSADLRFNWVAGVFFMKADSKYDPAITNSASAPGPFYLYADLKLTSYAAFAQGTYKFSDTTNLTGGLRYSSDDRAIVSNQFMLLPNGVLTDVVTPQDTSKNFAKPTWRLSLDHHFSPDVMGYASYNRGFRSGTYAPQIFPATPLNPEVLDAFEAGVKTDALDHRLRLNAAAFYYDYKNRQVLAIVNGFQQVYVAPKSVSYGADADLTWQATDSFALTAGASAIHARYKSFEDAVFTAGTNPGPFGYAVTIQSADGNTLESTPSWTFNVGPSYRLPTPAGEFTASANFYHNGGWWASPDNRARQPAYDTVAADLVWVPNFYRNLSLRAWGKNLSNKVYATQLTETGFGDNAEFAPGRTWGLTVDVRF